MSQEHKYCNEIVFAQRTEGGELLSETIHRQYYNRKEAQVRDGEELAAMLTEGVKQWSFQKAAEYLKTRAARQQSR